MDKKYSKILRVERVHTFLDKKMTSSSTETEKGEKNDGDRSIPTSKH